MFIAYLNLDFSSEIFDLYVEFLKYTVAKADSHTQIVSNTLVFQ